MAQFIFKLCILDSVLNAHFDTDLVKYDDFTTNLATLLLSQSTLPCQSLSLLYQDTISPHNSTKKLSHAIFKAVFELLSLCSTV